MLCIVHEKHERHEKNISRRFLADCVTLGIHFYPFGRRLGRSLVSVRNRRSGSP